MLIEVIIKTKKAIKIPIIYEANIISAEANVYITFLSSDLRRSKKHSPSVIAKLK